MTILRIKKPSIIYLGAMNVASWYYFILMFLAFPLLGIAQYAESEWEERDSWMPLDTIFEFANVKEGQAIADIGCHEGYLTVHLAKRLGKTGKVFAVDVRPDRLETLRANLKSRGLHNVDVILGDYDNPNLPLGRLDRVFIVDTYHEMVDYKSILNQVYKSLKPEGRLIIIEKLKKHIRGKTREEQIDAHSLSANYVTKELIEAGFEMFYQDEDMGHWENDPEKIIWMIVATKSN